MPRTPRLRSNGTSVSKRQRSPWKLFLTGALSHRNHSSIAISFYGRQPDVYRIIFQVSETIKEVAIVHIRHGARQAFTAADLN